MHGPALTRHRRRRGRVRKPKQKHIYVRVRTNPTPPLLVLLLGQNPPTPAPSLLNEKPGGVPGRGYSIRMYITRMARSQPAARYERRAAAHTHTRPMHSLAAYAFFYVAKPLCMYVCTRRGHICSLPNPPLVT